jgi:hypothetical protein
VQEALPALAGAAGAATDEQSWVSESAFELLSNVVAAAQPGALGGGFFGALAPSLFARLKATEDRDTLQVRAGLDPQRALGADGGAERRDVPDGGDPKGLRAGARVARRRGRVRTRPRARGDREAAGRPRGGGQPVHRGPARAPPPQGGPRGAAGAARSTTRDGDADDDGQVGPLPRGRASPRVCRAPLTRRRA